MIPVQFPEANIVIGASQDEYEPLPAHVGARDQQGRVTFCCALSDEEIREIVSTRRIWISQLTFGNVFQPILLATAKPDDLSA